MTIDWAGLRRIIDDHQSFILTTHIRPDCDAIGSTLALSHILRRLHKETVCLADFEVPPNLKFLDPNGEIHRLGHPRTEEWRASAEALVVLDTSAWAQLGDMANFLRDFPRTKIVLDHHISGDDLGARFFKDTRAEATGRIVAELADEL
ncbi:MAG: bifunctional oligoribonuclease/PAP phosphatase NrnA, partial [Thermogutta sp.]|nr:bifunctional oligoribonuclease/PAP phosphatase NrnA [Thermogutta sp.]